MSGFLARLGSSFTGRAEQTALVHSGIVAGLTFQRGLLPRTTRDQAIVTGASTAIGYGWAIALQSVTEAIAARLAGHPLATNGAGEGQRALAIAGNAAGAAAGGALWAAMRQREHEPIGRAALRTAGRGLVTTNVVGLAVGLVEAGLEAAGGRRGPIRRVPVALPLAAAGAGGMHFWIRQRELAARRAEGEDAQEDAAVSVRNAALMAAGVGTGLVTLALTERGIAAVVGAGVDVVVGQPTGISRPIGHLAALGLLGGALTTAYARAVQAQEEGSDAIEAAYNVPPEMDSVSGGPRSLVAWEPLSREGRRFVGMALTARDIENVMDEPAQDPLRLYVGLDSAGDPGSRVDLLLEEMLHMGAYDRGTLVVFAPTGSGYVNYVALEALEYFTRGDIASVCLQYSKRPSFMSLDRVGVGRHQVRDLLRAVSTRMETMPPEKRPRLLLFGESLGAHVSQDAFLHRGIEGLQARFIDAALWLGTPHASQWRSQVFEGPEPRPDSVVQLASPAELEELSEKDREAMRFVLLTHHEDPIPKFSPRLIVQRPSWLDPGEGREKGIAPEIVWAPIVTFLSVGVDLINAMHMVPGRFAAFAHDYRSDIRPFVQATYRLSADSDQVERIDQALREREGYWARQRVVADEMRKANESIKRQLDRLSEAIGT